MHNDLSKLVLVFFIASLFTIYLLPVEYLMSNQLVREFLNIFSVYIPTIQNLSNGADDPSLVKLYLSLGWLTVPFLIFYSIKKIKIPRAQYKKLNDEKAAMLLGSFLISSLLIFTLVYIFGYERGFNAVTRVSLFERSLRTNKIALAGAGTVMFSGLSIWLGLMARLIQYYFLSNKSRSGK